MAAEEDEVKIDQFDGKNFHLWKMQVENYLQKKKLHQPLLDVRPDDMPPEDWNLMDKQAQGAIRSALAENVASNVLNETTAAVLMTSFSNMYENTLASTKLCLMRRLFGLKMIEGASITDHINEFDLITSQLSSTNIMIDDEVKALILLASLPATWSAICSSSGSKKSKLSEVRDLILKEEDARLRGSGEKTDPSQRRRQRRVKDKSKGKSQLKPTDDTCWQCGEKGHIKRYCKGKTMKDVDQSQTTDDYSAQSVPIESWFIITSVSAHSTPCKEWMTNYVAGNFGKLNSIHDDPLDIVGKGDIKIRTPTGTVWNLMNVGHVPGLRRNYISVGQLAGEDYAMRLERGLWTITKQGSVIVSGVKNRHVMTFTG